MDWRVRVLVRWYLLAQAWIALTVIAAWSTRPILESLAILIGIPIASLWVPLLLVFVASTPGRYPQGDGVLRGLMVGTLTVVLWVTQLVMLALFLVFAIRLALGY
jgi:hypothetical protein